MGAERNTPLPFSERQTQMRSMVQYAMFNHSDKSLRIAWGNIQTEGLMLYPQTIDCIERAVSLAIAAGSRDELFKEARKYTATIKLPQNTERSVYTDIYKPDFDEMEANFPPLRRNSQAISQYLRIEVARQLATFDAAANNWNLLNENITMADHVQAVSEFTQKATKATQELIDSMNPRRGN